MFVGNSKGNQKRPYSYNVTDVNYKFVNLLNIIDDKFEKELVLMTIGRLLQKPSTSTNTMLRINEQFLSCLCDRNKTIPIIFEAQSIPDTSQFIQVFGRLQYSDKEEVGEEEVTKKEAKLAEAEVLLDHEEEMQQMEVDTNEKKAFNKAILVETFIIIKDETTAKKMQDLYEKLMVDV